jgi:transcriptional regulator with XRE-family HTH domain
MDARQYRKAIEELGWTQSKAAEELGIHQRTSRKYALGERPIPLTIELLLECLKEKHNGIQGR